MKMIWSLVLCQCLCILLILFILYRGLVFGRGNLSCAKDILPVAILPLGQFFYTKYIQMHLLALGRDCPRILLVSEILMFALGILWLRWAMHRGEREKVQRELKERKQASYLEEIHYQEVREKRTELQRICTEYEARLMEIYQLLRNQNMDDAQVEIEHLSEDILATRETPYCRIPVLNAVIAEKKQECERRGIDLQLDVHIDNTRIDSIYLCSIMGNMLDNAIAGVEEWAKRERRKEASDIRIRLSVEMVRDYLVIRTENPSLPPRKTPRPGHGYGSKIMRSIAEELGGSYVTDYRDGCYVAAVTCRDRDIL